MRCTLNKYTFPCGLNHLGNGHFFIILGKEKMKKSNTQFGEEVQFVLEVDPNPLGIEEPEVLSVLLDQDPVAKKQYNQLTNGKKGALSLDCSRQKTSTYKYRKSLVFWKSRPFEKDKTVHLCLTLFSNKFKTPI